MKKTFRRTLSMLLSMALICSMLTIFPLSASADTFSSKADFMTGKYGVFLHYLSNTTDLDSWNAKVNSFDTDKLADDASAMGASWVTLSLTQGNGIYCIPMPELQQLTGIACGSQRDLVLDLYDSLAAKNIKLMLYWIPGAPKNNNEMAAALGATERVSTNGDWMLNETVVNNMSSIMTAVSNRYGSKISGWWIDGSYTNTGFNEAYATQEANALGSGNSNAVVAFNQGTSYGDARFSVEDYSAGETCNPNTVSTNSFLDYSTNSRWTDNGYQKHYLTFLGTNWGGTGTIYNTNDLVEHSYNNILKNGGAISFDVNCSSNGTIDSAQKAQIVALRNYSDSAMSSLPLNFEHGTRETAYVQSVDTNHNVTTSEDPSYIDVANQDDALNGNYSLQIKAHEGISRVDALFARKFVGNNSFSKTDFSASTGIMLRLKLLNDSGTSNHKFALYAQQAGVPATWLGKGAVLYDVKGNPVTTTSGAQYTNIPAGFDGFVFMPFSSAASDKVSVPGAYDSYQTFPENMIDFSQAYSLMIKLYSPDWAGITAVVDDMSYYTGSRNSDAWNLMRSLGYSVIFNDQPDLYNFPLNFEYYELPYTAAKMTYTKTIIATGGKSWPSFSGNFGTIINDGNVLNGKVSYQTTFTPQAVSNDTETYAYGNIATDAIPFAGVPALAKSKIIAGGTDYARMSIRLSLPQSANGGDYVFAVKIRQSGYKDNMYLSGGVVGYNSNGTINNSVRTNGLRINVPSGFNGTLYLPIYSMRSEDVLNSAYVTYNNGADRMPDLSSDFGMYFFYADNFENVSFVMDDIDIVYNVNNLPYTFENDLNRQYQTITNAGSSYNGISYVGKNEALNGSYSMKVNVTQNNLRSETNGASLPGNSAFTYSDLSAVTGIMMRLKINEDNATSPGPHAFNLIASQSGKRTWLGSRDVQLYDLDGNSVSTSYGSFNFVLPEGFDGYIFVPFSSARIDSGSWTRYDGTNSSTFVDYSSTYYLTLCFGNAYAGGALNSSWSGSQVLIDDINYYSGTASTGHYDQIRALGYTLLKSEQPASYSLHLDFEDFELPFSKTTSYYSNGAGGYPTTEVQNKLVAAPDALSGDVSLKVTVPANESYDEAGYSYIRSETSKSLFTGSSDLNKAILANATANYAKLKVRIKAPVNNDGLPYTLNFAMQSAGSDIGYLGNSVKGYNIDGSYNSAVMSVSGINLSIPSGFDGYVYIPVNKMISERAINGAYSSYENNAAVMPDLTGAFNMWINFSGNSVKSAQFIFDDMSIEFNLDGDIDNNGKVNSTDILLLSKYLLGQNSLIAKMDVNNDTEVNVKDIVRLKKLCAIFVTQ